MKNVAIGHVEERTLYRELSDRYLAYAMSTIMARSLPDVRDGLKPVHRRLLFAMHQLRLNPASGFKKCARVVGDVIGKFHPHGDVAVYEALVRLAQDFAVRYPLIEGQGNFGSIDGDGAAAMRYTESRLTQTAVLMLEGVDEDAVDLRATYDNEDHEPVVLPGAFPNLLANGAAGIAVGMATNIPPHNIVELYRAAQKLVKKPDMDLDKLLEIVQGPDFPTGGIVVEDRETIRNIYATGRGGLRIRCKWEIEESKGGAWRIIVTELPYQVQKSRLIEQIATAMDQKKLPLLGDVSDESAADIRLVLEPRNRNVDPEVLMENLFKNSALENRFSVNLNVLGGGKIPEIMPIREALNAWIEHVHQVLIRRTSRRLEAVLKRLEILEGFLKLYLNLDEAIRLIRDEDDAKTALMNAFSLTELQAEYVLNMRLRALRRLEEEGIRLERENLSQEESELKALLGSEDLRRQKLCQTFKELEKTYAKLEVGKRRTLMASAPKEIDMTQLEEIEKEPLTLLISKEGWLRANKGHNLDLDTVKFKDGDALEYSVECQSTDRICAVGDQGRVYTLRMSDVARGRGWGQAIRTLIDLAPEEQLVSVFSFATDVKEALLLTAQARGMRVSLDNMASEKRSGRQVFNLDKNDKIIATYLSAPNSQSDQESREEGKEENKGYVLCMTTDKRALIFPEDQIPEMTRGKGVRLQKLGEGDEIRETRYFQGAQGLIWKEGQRPRKLVDLDKWTGNRGTVGKVAPQWMLRNS